MSENKEKTETKPHSWRTIRKKVWERDRGICQVCKLPCKWEYYECGHIVDRCCGGSDQLDNLVVMDIACNQLKPLHETKDEFYQWIENGEWYSDFRQYIKSIDCMPEMTEEQLFLEVHYYMRHLFAVEMCKK